MEHDFSFRAISMSKIQEARNKLAIEKARRHWKVLMKQAKKMNSSASASQITIENLSVLHAKKWEPEHFAAARKLRGTLTSLDHDVRFKFQSSYQAAMKYKQAKNFRVKPTQIFCMLGFVTFIILGLVLALASM
jgi:hypothetical protein